MSEKIEPRPPQLFEAIRLAEAAREQLIAAIDAMPDGGEFVDELHEALPVLEDAINYMTSAPEVEYLGKYVQSEARS